MKFHTHYLLLVAILLITLMPVAKADNILGTLDNVKSYDPVTKTVTISDWIGLGGKLADFKLLTPQINPVIAGNDRLVAKMQWNIYDKLSNENAIKTMELFMADKQLNENRNIKFKYLESTDYYDSPIQDTKCDKIEGKNGTEERCYSIDIGNQKNPIENWVEFNNPSELPENAIIGIFADVKPYDNVEWIPTWFGVKINEFATWQDSYSVGLFAYYNFEQAVGTFTLSEATGQRINGTLVTNGYSGTGSPVTVTGIVGNAWNFTGSVTKSVNLSWINPDIPNFTINYWLLANTITSEASAMGTEGGMSYRGNFDTNNFATSGKHRFAIRNSVNSNVILTSNQTAIVNVWQMLTMIYTDGGMKFYINGTIMATNTNVVNITNWNMVLASRGYDFCLKGAIDEIGYWNRTLTQDEITGIYNAGVGMTYTASSATPITFNYANLITPSDSFNTTQTSIYFVSNASVTNANLTNATVYLWNGGTKTNLTIMTGAMPYNMTNISYSGLTNNNYNWSVLYCAANETSSLCQYVATNNSFIIDSTKPIPMILSPLNQSYKDNVSWMNFSASDTHLESCWYSLDGGGTTTAVTCGDNATDLTSIEGTNTWTFYANDTFGNANETSITFWKDTIAPEINIVYPENATYNRLSLDLNFTVSDVNIEDCWYSIDDGTTNVSLTCGDNVTETASEGSNIWLVGANDTSGNENMSRMIFIADTISPTIKIDFPSINQIHAMDNGDLSLNFTASDASSAIDSTWYSIDNSATNTTITGNDTISGLEVNDYTIDFWLNDSAGNMNYSQVNFTVVNVSIGKSYNTIVMTTTTQSYNQKINHSGSVSVTPRFNYNHSYISSGITGTYDYSQQVLTIGTDIPLFWNFLFSYNGNTIQYNSTEDYQNVSDYSLAICDGTSSMAINFTFRDETADTRINATLDASTWTYKVSGTDGTYTKTYLFSNLTHNDEYAFCISPNYTNLTINANVQYSHSEVTTYPQRQWQTTAYELTNTTSNVILYLLASTDGQYVTFQVVNTALQPLSDVEVVAKRLILGTLTTIETKVTDSSGGATMWLNPLYSHQLTFTKTGYITYTTSITPSQTQYTITMTQSGTANITDWNQGLNYSIVPALNYLNKSTNYDFGFTINSSLYTITYFAMNISNSTSLISTNSSISNGGSLFRTLNTSDNSRITSTFYWQIGGNNYSTLKTFLVSDISNSDYSIRYLFSDLRTYVTSGLFGLDDFGLTVIIFLIIFISAGILCFNFGIYSPAAIAGLIFAETMFFDVGLGMIVNPVGAISNFPTIFMAVVTLALIIKEATSY